MHGIGAKMVPAFLALALFPYAVLSYSSGGPESVCNSLMPGHGVGWQRGQTPFNITTSTSQVSAGSAITATITGTRPFKGFFIRVKQGDTYVNGEFTDNGGNKDRCSKTGVTHNNPTMKDRVQVVFRFGSRLRPEDGNPMFVAAIVEEKSTIWQINSPELTVSSGGNAPANPTQPPSQNNQPSTPGSNGSNGDDDDDDDDNDYDGGIMVEVGTPLLFASLVFVWLTGWQ